MGMRRKKHRLGNTDQQVKKYKEPRIRVNICWEVGEERKCVTLEKSDAYATREWVDKNNGCVYWFSPVEH